MLSNMSDLPSSLKRVDLSPPPSPRRLDVPLSPTKRRRFFQETDPADDECLIEDYMYRLDPFRSSSKKPPLPWPMRQDTLRTDLAHPSVQLRQAITSQLKLHRIEASKIAFRLLSKPGYTYGSDAKWPALIVEIDVPDNVDVRGWSAARRALSTLLESDFNIWDCEVELIDVQRCFCPAIHTIPPSHPSISLYDQVRQRLIERVIRELKSNWVAMSIFKLQPNHTQPETTYDVVLYVKPYTRHEWGNLRIRMQHIINDVARDRIGLQIIPGEFGMCINGDSAGRPGEPFVKELQPFPEVGSSIGVKGESGGGSLGCFMTLDVQGRKHRGFLTNSQVVAPSSTQAPHVRADFDKNGVQRNTAPDDKKRTFIQWLAKKDVDATMKAAKEDEEFARSEIQRFESEKEMKEILGKDTYSTLGNIARNKGYLETAMADQALCQKMPITLGQVMFATGRGTTTSGSVLDFAFVKLDEDAPGMRQRFEDRVANKIPPHTLRDIERGGPDKFDKTLPRIGAPEMLADADGVLTKGEWYFKVGRTSKVTTGLCHGIEMYVNMGTNRRLYDEQGRAGSYDHVEYSHDMVVVNGPNPGDSPHFCDQGDSGSCVVDRDGKVAGLTFGFVKGKVGPEATRDEWSGGYAGCAGTVTPIRDVIKYMKLITAPKSPETGRPTGEPGATLELIV